MSRAAIQIVRVQLGVIASLRSQFLAERNFQFVHNKCHDYGWADTYAFYIDEVPAGYGSVWGTDRRQDRDTIFEFYVPQPFHDEANNLFTGLVQLSGVHYIESQTNDPLLMSMLLEYGHDINAEAILFRDSSETQLTVRGARFREREADDDLGDDNSDFVMEYNGEIAATGGLMLNYNLPYADIYMQVNERFRRIGLGSYLVQELKRVARAKGRVPAARCNIDNKISKATLIKGGLVPCGFWLKGVVSKLKS